jgi:hypothetical protein
MRPLTGAHRRGSRMVIHFSFVPSDTIQLLSESPPHFHHRCTPLTGYRGPAEDIRRGEEEERRRRIYLNSKGWIFKFQGEDKGVDDSSRGNGNIQTISLHDSFPKKGQELEEKKRGRESRQTINEFKKCSSISILHWLLGSEVRTRAEK